MVSQPAACGAASGARTTRPRDAPSVVTPTSEAPSAANENDVVACSPAMTVVHVPAARSQQVDVDLRPADHDVHEQPGAVRRHRDGRPRLRVVGCSAHTTGSSSHGVAEHVVVHGAVVLVAGGIAGVGEAGAVGLPRHAARPRRRDRLAAIGAVGGVEHAQDGVLAAGLARADGDERAVG